MDSVNDALGCEGVLVWRAAKMPIQKSLEVVSDLKTVLKIHDFGSADGLSSASECLDILWGESVWIGELFEQPKAFGSTVFQIERKSGSDFFILKGNSFNESTTVHFLKPTLQMRCIRE